MANLNASDRLGIALAIGPSCLLFVLDKAGKLNGAATYALTAVAACGLIPLLFNVEWVTQAPDAAQGMLRRLFIVFCLGALSCLVCLWLTPREAPTGAVNPSPKVVATRLPVEIPPASLATPAPEQHYRPKTHPTLPLREPSAAPAVPPTTSQVIAPNGIAIGGNNYGNPQVNNYSSEARPPQITWSVQKAPDIVLPTRAMRNLPYNGPIATDADGNVTISGLQISITLSDDFHNPAFEIIANHPWSLHFISASDIAGVEYGIETGDTPASMVVVISQPRLLRRGQVVFVSIQEAIGTPLSISAVQAIVR